MLHLRILPIVLAMALVPVKLLADTQADEKCQITWAEVQALVESNPDSVKSLIERVTTGDKALSNAEALVAYMGNSYFNGSPMSESMKGRKAWKEGNKDLAVELLGQAVESNPLSLANNYYFVFFALKNKPAKDIKEKIKLALARIKLLETAILASGNGTQEAPFKVTCIDDEYVLMERLKLPRPTMQALTNGGCDKFTLPAHTSTLFTGQEIFFDASRISQLQLPNDLFD